VRINAAVREDGLNYSSFISSLKKSNVALNRKMIAQIAISDKNCFRELIQSTK
jgi:large subunit ribosomal protein L20